MPAERVKQQVKLYESNPTADLSQVHRRVLIRDKPAYLLLSTCCDLPDFLYDSEGNILCRASNGRGGPGDKECADALARR